MTQAWQPIATAPRDGERILLYSPQRLTRNGKFKILRDAWICIGFWRSPDEAQMNEHKHGLYMKHDGYWTNHFKGTQPLKGCPTHWQPLPEPPKKDD